MKRLNVNHYWSKTNLITSKDSPVGAIATNLVVALLFGALSYWCLTIGFVIFLVPCLVLTLMGITTVCVEIYFLLDQKN